MYYFDNIQHSTAHIHVHYQENSAVIEIPGGEVLEGRLPTRKQKLVDAWIEIHREELLEDWKLAVNGESVFKISPLK